MGVGSFVYHECEDNCLTLYHSLVVKVKPSHLQCKVVREVHLNKLFNKLAVFVLALFLCVKLSTGCLATKLMTFFALITLFTSSKRLDQILRVEGLSFLYQNICLHICTIHMCAHMHVHTHASSSFPKSCD